MSHRLPTLASPVTRRQFLRELAVTASLPTMTALAALTGCAQRPYSPLQRSLSRAPILPIDFASAQEARTKVGLRPFRATGFVLKRELFADKALVHNYGHGGAGITLSWGCAQMAADSLADIADRRAIVIGSGVIGLTTATVLRERGWAVDVYARDFPPNTTSDVAGGQWAPTSVHSRGAATAEFQQQLASALAGSFARFSAMSNTAKSGVRWRESYYLLGRGETPVHYAMEFPEYFPNARILPIGAHPFPTAEVFTHDVLMIEPAIFLPKLMRDLQASGCRFVEREFTSAEEWKSLPAPVLVNCSGFGARALLGDEELVPVRGQLLLLPADSRIDYLTHGGGAGLLYMFPREDGIVLGGSYERGVTSLVASQEVSQRLLAEHSRISAAIRLS